MIPSLATLKLIGIGVGALAVIALFAMVMGWRTERNHLRDWQTTVLAATRDAAGNPKLGAKDVPQQVKLLGQAVADLKAAAAKQNAAVNALAAESARQQADAAKASQKAATRAHEAEGVGQRLDASSRQKPPPGPSCAASTVVQEQWQ